MFGKSKQNKGIVSNVSTNRVKVYDFQRRQTKFESYRPPEYVFYPGLEEPVVIPILDDHLAKMFVGDIDEGNGNDLNNLIFSIVAQGECFLERQRYRNLNLIPRLTARNQVDGEDFKNMLKQREDELEDLLEQQKIINQLMENRNKGGKKR